MVCLACNKPLSDFEATTKFQSGYFVDLCTACIEKSEIPVDSLIFNPRFVKDHDDVGEGYIVEDEM